METILMNETVRLCRADEVREGQPVAVRIAGLPAVAVYEIAGEHFVTADSCTHGNGILSDGYQEGGTIVCPFHGGGFDIRTGAATKFPCRTPVKTYPVHLEDGWLAIQTPRCREG